MQSKEAKPGKPAIVNVLALCGPRSDAGWGQHTLELLGDGAQLAKRLGGLTAAFLLPPFPSDEKINDLGAYGCDRALCLENARLEAWASEAVAEAVAQALTPGCRVLLVPAGARGEEVAGLLAGKLGGHWIADAISLTATRSGDLEITAALSGGRLARSFRSAGTAPLVVTMREGVAEARKEASAREPERVEIPITLASVPELTKVTSFLPADPKTQEITFARKIVAAGRGAGGPDGIRLVGRLAESLRASLAASRVAVDLGWVPSERQVGQTGRTVRPDLYIACGISGASHHLAGMRDSKHIIAINPDASAPIHEVAHLSVQGDLREVIPALEAALVRRKPGEASGELK